MEQTQSYAQKLEQEKRKAQDDVNQLQQKKGKQILIFVNWNKKRREYKLKLVF